MRYMVCALCAHALFVAVATVKIVHADDPSASPLDLHTQRSRVITTMVETEVAAAIEKSRKLLETDPATAEANLRLTLQWLHSNVDVAVDVRTELANQLNSAIRQATRRKVELEVQQSDRQQADASRRAQRHLTTNERRRQEKLAKQIAILDALIAEKRNPEAVTDAIANSARRTSDESTVTSALMTAANRNGIVRQQTIVAQQISGFQSSMLDAQASAIPMRGSSPVEYPSADRWREISISRQKYAADNLFRPGPAELKIRSALDKQTMMDFEDVPLDEVASYLGDYHDIAVLVDNRALEDIGLDGSVRVDFQLKGISLRSALRHLLRQIDPLLTFTIRDEVLLITTKESVENHLETRIYPVAELVLPIQLLDSVNPGGLSADAAATGFGNNPFGQQGGQDPNQQNNIPFDFNQGF